MRMYLWLAVSAAVVAVGAVLVLQPVRTSKTSPAAATATASAPAPRYSPFVLEMSHPDLPFSRISFKDVGLSEPVEHRARVYETIAESLSLELASDPELPMSSEVLYSPAYADPNQHLACGAAQIYADVWQSPDRYGYSLWSGCSENDRFAWGEVDRRMEPLARDIAKALRDAVSTGCFTRRC